MSGYSIHLRAPNTHISQYLLGIFALFVMLYPITTEASPNIPLYDWKSDQVRRVLSLCQTGISTATLPLRSDIVLSALKQADDTDCVPAGTPLKVLMEDVITVMEKEDQKSFAGAYRIRMQLSDHPFNPDNSFGERIDKGLRSTFDIRLYGSLPYGLSYEFVPQLQVSRIGDENHSTGDIFIGYIKWTHKNIEIEGGRDTLWWGPGYHGNTTLTNNIEPLDLIKLSNVYPFHLPWVFGHLGDTNLMVFGSRLSSQTIRYIDEGTEKIKKKPPYFLGIRGELHPASYIHFGASLASQFIGRNNSLNRISDWKAILLPSWEGNEGEGTEGPVANRRYSYDFMIQTNRIPRILNSELYWEYGGEVGIISGALNIPFPKPQYINEVIGVYLDFGGADLRLEVSAPFKNPLEGSIYSHGQFTEGYRHEGRIIGHHIGPGARDFFLRTTFLTKSRAILGIDIDHEQHYIEDWSETIIGTDVTLRKGPSRTYQLRYQWHDGNRDYGIRDIHYLALSLFYQF